jgi:hypothetical protein
MERGILCMVFPALYDASAIDVGGIVLFLVWGVICLIPFGFFVRGTARS